ncbi:hypothetical protein [Novosphingobium guangzhouense]|uniref:Uncharacterized protein n=1 Tax=Novosphingobium guangzhouense TaxID=1850347 RepID=A0A2K2G1J9_9SPHN|nr:hypothetical protein [Novosphingobium guangzhouense]PNU04920.1 hypothetical protein A8V01_03505 [Novosphingobium guangzhouense]
MIRLIKTIALIAALCVATWFVAHWYAEYRVRTAFAEAGLSERAAECMGRRLVRKLSLRQVHKLTALQDAVHTPEGMVKAARRIDDPRVVKVTASSLLLCSTGLSR